MDDWMSDEVRNDSAVTSNSALASGGVTEVNSRLVSDDNLSDKTIWMTGGRMIMMYPRSETVLGNIKCRFSGTAGRSHQLSYHVAIADYWLYTPCTDFWHSCMRH